MNCIRCDEQKNEFKCSACLAPYCSQNCATTHWSEHKKLCVQPPLIYNGVTGVNLQKSPTSRGDAALAAGKFDEAIQAYSEAIKLDKSNHVLYSNRAAVFLKAKRFQEAFSDSESIIQLEPTWPKGYTLRGAALFALDNFDKLNCYGKLTCQDSLGESKQHEKNPQLFKKSSSKHQQPKKPKVNCQFCAKQLSKSSIVEHLRRCDKNPMRNPLICPTCNKEYYRWDQFNKHVDVHNPREILD